MSELKNFLATLQFGTHNCVSRVSEQEEMMANSPECQVEKNTHRRPSVAEGLKLDTSTTKMKCLGFLNGCQRLRDFSRFFSSQPHSLVPLTYVCVCVCLLIRFCPLYIDQSYKLESQVTNQIMLHISL